MTIFHRPTTAAAAGDPIPFATGGATHLFYLSSPSGTTDYPERVRTTWQHVCTTDFRHWDVLPPAVEPGAVGDFDGGGIWTGSVVEKDGTFYLFYTGHHVGAANPQTICLATSTDLITFQRHARNPLLLPTAAFEPVDWRDPYVFFNEEERRWWMLIAARLGEGPRWRRGCIVLATSSNLLDWEVEPDPLYTPGTTYCPECPEMWEMGGRWYMVFSRFSEEVGTVYRVADNPRGPFRVPSDEDLGGRRWYAAKSAPQADGSRVFFGWLHDFVTEGGRPRWLWGGDFTAPRVVTADPDGALALRLHPAVETLFGDAAPVHVDIKGVGGAAHSQPGEAVPARCLLRASIETSQAPSSCGVALVGDADLEGWFVTLDRARRRVTLAQEPRPLDDFWADLTGRPSAYRNVDGPVVAEMPFDAGTSHHDITLLLDGEILEVYVDDRTALTHRIDRTTALHPTVFVVDGDLAATLRVAVPA